MPIKRLNILRQRDHWYAEWWGSVFLIAVGVYALLMPNSEILHRSLVDGFLTFFPVDIWELLFIGIGFFQFCMLFTESMWGRGIAAFFASSLLIWGFLNIFLFGQWHFSLVAWGVFSSINLYALSRILTGLEKCNEPL